MCVQCILRSLRSFKGVPKTRKIKNKYWIVCECNFERGHVSNYSRKCRNPLTLNSNVIVFRESHASIKRAKFQQSATKLLLHCLKSKTKWNNTPLQMRVRKFFCISRHFSFSIFNCLLFNYPFIYCFIILLFLFFLPRADREEMRANATRDSQKSQTDRSNLVGNIHGQDIEAAKQPVQ